MTIKRMGHVSVVVNDLATAIAFFTTLGMALEGETAQLWCEKMSRTTYGQWRYLFLQQKKLEALLTSGAKSLADLTRALGLHRV